MKKLASTILVFGVLVSALVLVTPAFAACTDGTAVPDTLSCNTDDPDGVSMGDGDDSLTITDLPTINGLIDGGIGTDTITFIEPQTGSGRYVIHTVNCTNLPSLCAGTVTRTVNGKTYSATGFETVIYHRWRAF